MTKLIDELSVFLPAYNEEKNIEKTVNGVLAVLPGVAGKWEVIIVDDGSSDRTGGISDTMAAKNKHVRVVHHHPNRGYGGALKSGYETSRFQWVAFMDSDGQFDFSEIKLFIEAQKLTGADLVLGIRIGRADAFIRKFYTFVWSKLLPRILLGLKVTDYSCGYKLINKKVYTGVQPLIGEEKVTQIEMLTKAQRMGFKFAQVRVHHYPRRFGHNTGADLKVIIRSIRDLLKLWYQLR